MLETQKPDQIGVSSVKGSDGMDDFQLIERFFGRDERALAETEKRYGTFARSVAGRIVGNREDAEECVNDALMRLWNSIPPERPDNFRAYLARIVKNLALDRVRRAGAAKRAGCGEPLDELADDLPSPEGVDEMVAARELGRSLDRFLDGLSERERDLFVARYWYRASTAELAKKAGMSETAVKSALARTRTKLKSWLEEEQ